MDMESKFLKLVAAIKAALAQASCAPKAKTVTEAQPFPQAVASQQEGLKCLLDAGPCCSHGRRSEQRWTPLVFACVLGGLRVCPRTPVLLPSPSLISLRLPPAPPGPCLPFYPMVCRVVLLQASFSRGSREQDQDECVSDFSSDGNGSQLNKWW